jgi:hypothetical protein
VWGCGGVNPKLGTFFFGPYSVCVVYFVWYCSGIRRKTERLRAVDFSILKNPTASVGSEPAILGSRYWMEISGQLLTVSALFPRKAPPILIG